MDILFYRLPEFRGEVPRDPGGDQPPRATPPLLRYTGGQNAHFQVQTTCRIFPNTYIIMPIKKLLKDFFTG